MKKALSLGCVALLAMTAAARADDMAPAICALEQTIACSPFEECERSLPGAVNLPVLMRVDPAAGVIVSRTEAGAERRSAIASTSVSGDDLMLTGTDEGNPWSLRASTVTGRFSLVVLHADATFIGFGVCSRSLLQ